MQKRHKDLMRTLVTELRHILVGSTASDGTIIRCDLDRELERLGIAPDGTITPLDAMANPAPNEQQAHRMAVAQLVYCDEPQRASMRMEIIERAAYSWINRLLALRAMEARGLIDETLRTNPEYDGLPEALYILRQSDPVRTSGADGGRWAVIEDACQAQAASLPGLFALDDPATTLRPSTPALIRCMALVGGSMPGFSLAESDAAFADPDAIGWAYQFYQVETKARIYAKLGSGGKAATRSEIAAATELFTEPYMVKWLLQNSLGRSYHEIYPDSALPATWEYYIKPDTLDTSTTFTLASLTVLDPCMGSGHFLREAFDMLVTIYREQFHTYTTTEIADRILSHHLYGIDLDPRAAQLSALTLYLRAWELIRDERQKERKPGPGTYTPLAMNLATTPTSLNEGALQRHLQRHPQDMPLQPLLEGIFSSLEQADILGSLIRPKEFLDNAIIQLQKMYNIPLDPEEAEIRRTITELANRDPLGLRQMLLNRVADSFKAEAGNTDDVSAALFGREAEQGVRLLQLLDRQYAVVVTNPPYMGSKNMDTPLKKYVEKYYPSGKRDICCAFILRCLHLCQPNGRVAMITMQSWMFLSSYAELRAMPDEKLVGERKKNSFSGLLKETCMEALAQLGPYGFEEIGGAVVQSAMFVLKNSLPSSYHRIMAYRLVGTQNPKEKAELLSTKTNRSRQRIFFQITQKSILSIPLAPLAFWLPNNILDLLGGENTVGQISEPLRGLDTGDMPRFVRWWWETGNNVAWSSYVNGGTHRKWIGLRLYTVLWEYNGAKVKAFPGSIVPNEHKYHEKGLTFSDMCSGSFNCRVKEATDIFGVSGSSIFEKNRPILEVASILNTRVCSYILRAISPTPKFRTGYVRILPYPNLKSSHESSLVENVKACITLKGDIVFRDLTEQYFEQIDQLQGIKLYSHSVEAILHSLEGFNELLIFEAFALTRNDIESILEETGIPAGWNPLIESYDTPPTLPPELDPSALPQKLFDYLAMHERISTDDKELARIKANLCMLYEAGPGAKNIELEENDETTEDDVGEDEIASGAYIPIPTETFLEELSVKMQIHPISVYWLLEELMAEGARCKPEEQRLLEDRLSVLVLRLLGHRWPKQLEAEEPVPSWTSSDGIIPLVAETGETTLAEQVRALLRVEDGELGVQQTEALLTELTGLSLEGWLRRRFYSRHVSQFKYRPIAWHLASTPTNTGKKKRGGSQRSPAFECLLYYHACSGDALARIRTQYVEPLLRAERQKMQDASLFEDETTTVLANERIQELEAFIEKLRGIEEKGFACPELDTFMGKEPLDRWSGDGYLAPASREELLRNEQAWHVDINEGVRVNIAPLQLAGVLVSDVLKVADAKKALADRARWRADERRWVRDGKLPRCGWMDKQVPESPRWTERDPERLAAQIKLEQKRLTLQGRQAEEVEV